MLQCDLRNYLPMRKHSELARKSILSLGENGLFIVIARKSFYRFLYRGNEAVLLEEVLGLDCKVSGILNEQVIVLYCYLFVLLFYLNVFAVDSERGNNADTRYD